MLLCADQEEGEWTFWCGVLGAVCTIDRIHVRVSVCWPATQFAYVGTLDQPCGSTSQASTFAPDDRRVEG